MARHKLAFDKDSISVDCPLCGSEAAKKIYHKKVWGGDDDDCFVRCGQCDVVFLYPFPDVDSLESFYANDFGTYMLNRASEINWDDLSRQYDNLSHRELPLRNSLLSTNLRNGSVLEVGSSTGFLLDEIRESGRVCHGVEPSQQHAEFSRSRGNTIFSSMAEVQMQYENVLHYYVLEHVINPDGFMRACLDRLKPGGQMIFECPHRDDALLAYYKCESYKDYILQKMHLFYYSVQALRFLLDTLPLSYKIIPGQRYGLSNHLNWLRQGAPCGSGLLSLISDKTEDSYCQDIIRSGYFDYICVVGRKL